MLTAWLKNTFLRHKDGLPVPPPDNSHALKPGDMVVLKQHTVNPIKARRAAKFVDRSRGEDDVIICEIPNDSFALYIDMTQVPGRHQVSARAGALEHFIAQGTTFYRVLWNGMAVWISGENTGLKKVT